MWNLFAKYHYLDSSLHQACTQYVGVYNGQIVCHTGVIQFPMRKGWKRVHRFVVLPDYQGVGIGTHFIKEIAKIYTNKGMEFNLTTTTPALIYALAKDKDWILKRKGRNQGDYSAFSSYGGAYTHLANKRSNNRITFSYWFRG